MAFIIARTSLIPSLRSLSLSGSNLTSKSHIHTLTPCRGGCLGIGCDGGCDSSRFQGSNAFKHFAQCDLEFCSACCMSECPMVALANALDRLPHLVSLKRASARSRAAARARCACTRMVA